MRSDDVQDVFLKKGTAQGIGEVFAATQADFCFLKHSGLEESDKL